MKISKKIIILGLLFGFVLPPVASAHLVSEDGAEEDIYEVTISITGLSVVDDQNFFDFIKADALFDYKVEPINPEHETETGVTIEAVTIGDNETKTFGPKQIYQHEICGCEQDFDLTINAMDYSPKQFFAKDIVIGGVRLSSSFLFGGVTGVIIKAAGQAVGKLVDALTKIGMSDEEAKALAEEKLRKSSYALGRMEDSITTGCDNLSETFMSPLFLEEIENGDITYRVDKVLTENYCFLGEEGEVGNTGDSEEGPVGTDPPSQEEDLTCNPATGLWSEHDPLRGWCSFGATSPSANQSCQCLPGYEWRNTNDLCEGCKKTNKDACLEATKQSIDWATGTISPDLSFVGDKYILWYAGEGRCSNRPQVIADFSQYINEAIPMYNQQCPDLKLIEGRNSQVGECSIEFLFQYTN